MEKKYYLILLLLPLLLFAQEEKGTFELAFECEPLAEKNAIRITGSRTDLPDRTILTLMVHEMTGDGADAVQRKFLTSQRAMVEKGKIDTEIRLNALPPGYYRVSVEIDTRRQYREVLAELAKKDVPAADSLCTVGTQEEIGKRLQAEQEEEQKRRKEAEKQGLLRGNMKTIGQHYEFLQNSLRNGRKTGTEQPLDDLIEALGEIEKAKDLLEGMPEGERNEFETHLRETTGQMERIRDDLPQKPPQALLQSLQLAGRSCIACHRQFRKDKPPLHLFQE